jgi:hypothetical protein
MHLRVVEKFEVCDTHARALEDLRAKLAHCQHGNFTVWLSAFGRRTSVGRLPEPPGEIDGRLPPQRTDSTEQLHVVTTSESRGNTRTHTYTHTHSQYKRERGTGGVGKEGRGEGWREPGRELARERESERASGESERAIPDRIHVGPPPRLERGIEIPFPAALQGYGRYISRHSSSRGGILPAPTGRYTPSPSPPSRIAFLVMRGRERQGGLRFVGVLVVRSAGDRAFGSRRRRAEKIFQQPMLLEAPVGKQIMRGSEDKLIKYVPESTGQLSSKDVAVR